MIRNIVFLVVFFLALTLQAQPIRSVDAFGNNFENPEWGSAGAELSTWTSNGFQDSIGQPGGMFRPNARLVSNQLFSQNEDLPDERGLTEYVWVFGQFIDHDITLVSQNFSEYLPIKVPNNDLHFEPGAFLPFFRSHALPGSGESTMQPRKYANEITAFIDASTVYGSDENRANWLRTFEEGKLKTSQNGLLPWNTIDGEFNSPVDPNAPPMDDETGISGKFFIAGDVRANEHPLLIAMHTLFVREHNRICDSLYTLYPHWEDEVIYQKARKTVGGIIQAISYNEWLPAMGIHIDTEPSYDLTVNPNISNVFSAAAFRLGHTLITDDIPMRRYAGEQRIMDSIPLRKAFFNPVLLPLSGGLDPFLWGIAHRLQQRVDCMVVDGVRNFLFGGPSTGGLDLVAMNIMRGRDRGLPDYNTIRSNMGLTPLESFEDLSEDAQLIDNLRFLYGNIDNVDPWVGMLAEDHMEDAMFGELLHVILKRQFEQLRNGDRFFYAFDSGLTEEEKIQIHHTRLSEVIRRNTSLEEIQDNVFFYESIEQEPEGPALVAQTLDAVAYPLPFRDHLKVDFYLEEEAEVHFALLDVFGHRILEETILAPSGINRWSVGIDPSLPSGFFTLLLESGEQFRVIKLRKDR
jgi:peroxidase